MIRSFQLLTISIIPITTAGLALAQDPPVSPEQEAAPEPSPGQEAAPEPSPSPDTSPSPDMSTSPGQAMSPMSPMSPLTLPRGKLLIAGSTVNLNMSDDSFGEPLSLAPNVWYGLTDKLTVGLTHDFGTTPLSPRPAFRELTFSELGVDRTIFAGAGICVTGEPECPEVYDNVGIDLLFALTAEKLAIALHPGIDASVFDPFTLGIRVGVLGRYQVNDQISIVFDPRLGIGITERDNNNEEGIDLPVWAWYAINPRFGAYVHSALVARFEDFDDSYRVPLQIGASYMINERFTAGLDLAFLELNDGFDSRALGARAIIAL